MGKRPGHEHVLSLSSFLKYTSGKMGELVEAPSAINMELSDTQMALRQAIKAFTEKRIADFDAGDVEGTMEAWARDDPTLFKVTYPKAKKDDVVVEGFDAIHGLETTFANMIKDNFGKSWHELDQWKWTVIEPDEVNVSVYTRLWLTDKETGQWKQQDLSGLTGRFWMECKHKKVGDEWKIHSQVAYSMDEV